MITSKLTRKGQTTIPQAVRAALGVKPGDEIAYAIADGHVLLTKAAPATLRRGEDPFAAFWEWRTPEDDEAFGDLQQAPRRTYFQPYLLSAPHPAFRHLVRFAEKGNPPDRAQIFEKHRELEAHRKMFSLCS